MNRLWHEAQQRVFGRRAVVAATVLLTIAYAAIAGLSLAGSAIGILVVLIWAAVWPDSRRQRGSDPEQARSDEPSYTSRNRAILQDMMDAVPDPVLVLDLKRTVIRANALAREQFGEANGRHIAQVSRAPELLAAVEKAQAFRQKQTFDIHDLTPVERHLAGVVAPLTPEQGAAGDPALVIVFRDRTEAEQLAQMRADFVANASHELRTPLASLKGFVETLQTAAKDDPQAREQFLGIMQDQATRMSRLIEDLLSLSRIEMREHVAPTAQVDLSAVAAEAVAALQPVAKSRSITLTSTLTANAIAIGDRDELTQVAQNLIQNAIKYGRVGGHVDVSVKVEHNRALLVVSDDGIGIAPQHLPRLTERFYRVSAKDSRERGGTGLGLAIVKHIVNRHRGHLGIESVEGQGSTFIVSLPSA